jgi:hypothetical protein
MPGLSSLHHTQGDREEAVTQLIKKTIPTAAVSCQNRGRFLCDQPADDLACLVHSNRATTSSVLGVVIQPSAAFGKSEPP